MPSSRILGIDFGSKRMGLAVSDPLGITAQGIETMQSRGRRSDLAYLVRIVRKYEVSEIVVGLPLRLSGEAGPQAERVREFATDLSQRVPIPVHLWDERLSSAEAHRVLDAEGASLERRRQTVDRMAAVLILQSFLQARSIAPQQDFRTTI